MVKVNVDMKKDEIHSNQNSSSPTEQAGQFDSVQTPTTIANTRPLTQASRKTSAGWIVFFAVLGILQILGVLALIKIASWSTRQAEDGVISDVQFVSSILFLVLTLAAGALIIITTFVNLIGLLIYMIRRKPRGKALVFSILSLLFSAILLSFGAYLLYQTTVDQPTQREESVERMRSEAMLRIEKSQKDNANPEISKEEAIVLLQTCQLKGFYYTKEMYEEHGTSPATSLTGIVLTKVDGEPHRINIADKLIDELVPIAREAQKTCGSPQFWRDGTFEQYQDGKWQFRGEDVDTTPNDVPGQVQSPVTDM